MSDLDITYLVVCVVCVGLSAFYASAEIAFINLERLRIKSLQKEGRRGADRVARIMEYPERFLSVVLTSISFTETVAVALGGFLFLSLLEDPLGETTATAIGIAVMAIVLLLFVKVIPKTVAAQHHEGMALVYAPVIDVTSRVVSPIVWVLGWITDRVIPGHAHFIPGSLMSKQELRTCIDMSHEGGMVDDASARMLRQVVKFGDKFVREVMTPRTDVVGVVEGATLGNFKRIYAESPQRRYPVYEGNLDRIKGFLLSKDAHVAWGKGDLDEGSCVTVLARPVYLVPGTKLVGTLFSEMRERGVSLAVVLSEYGGTSGIVHIDQLVEEIVGEVREELVVEEQEYEQISENMYQMDGAVRIEEANEELGLGIPDGIEFETVAGFVLHIAGHLPDIGESVRHESLTFMVTEVDGSRISKLVVSKHDGTEDDSSRGEVREPESEDEDQGQNT
jgi:CBS domain containing-hemolysin-like protein